MQHSRLASPSFSRSHSPSYRARLRFTTRINVRNIVTPKNVAIVTARLTNDTDLRWDASQDTDLAGYEIVWRDTTSAVWTNSAFVPAGTNTYTAKAMSKDNFFFGVRAVDKDGNRSPVVYPRPMR